MRAYLTLGIGQNYSCVSVIVINRSVSTKRILPT